MSEFAAYDPSATGPPGIDPLIEPMQGQDVRACAAIAAAREHGSPTRWVESFERTITDHRRMGLVARLHHQVVGYGTAAYLEPVAAGGHGAPDGWYPTGLVVSPAWRRHGVGRRLTAARVDRLASVTNQVWYFAAALNRATVDLHHGLGFREMTRDFTIPGVTFTGGEGILFARSEPATREE